MTLLEMRLLPVLVALPLPLLPWLAVLLSAAAPMMRALQIMVPQLVVPLVLEVRLLPVLVALPLPLLPKLALLLGTAPLAPLAALPATRGSQRHENS